MRIFSFLLVVLFLGSSCVKDPNTLQDDIEAIENYLLENNLTAQVTEEMVYYIVEESGSVEKPTSESVVDVNYTGYYLDGWVFDSNLGKDPISGLVSGFVDGYAIGLQQFGKGGKGTILMPSSLGYGSNPPSGLRRDAVLVFDIELVDFE